MDASRLKPIARRLNKARKINAGKLPLDIFPIALDIAGSYPAIEIVIRVMDGKRFKGFALKHRSHNEQGWNSKYHIVGTVVRKYDTRYKIFSRLGKELIMSANDLSSKARFLTTRLCYEKPRNCSCLSVVYSIDLPIAHIGALSGKWKVFKRVDLSAKNIIDFHALLLRHICKHPGAVPPFEV